MFHKLTSLQKLVNQLRHIPFLATKNLYRVAHYFLQASPEQIAAFCDAIKEARESIRRCAECRNLTENSARCGICKSNIRDHGLLCVVETWQDLYAIERSGQYNGIYHVLEGVLSPLEGIGPEDLSIDHLLERVGAGKIQEVIFAFNATPEADATVSYLLSKLPHAGVVYSQLASGLPMGGHVSYMDKTTLYKALLGRRPIQ